MNVSVRNFQSLRKVDLQVEGLTVVVGPSNLGKSALIRAMEGALYNRPGDEFVRIGASTAEVTVDAVSWRKGGTVNEYRIASEVYRKVGTDAPDPVRALGYRDVWVGDAARKRGESIRPQIADQFHPLFILDRSSGFISDVLNLITRLAVVQRAADACGADLRSTKQVLGTRKADLPEAEAKLEALAPVVALHERVKFLDLEVRTLMQCATAVERVRGLLQEAAEWRKRAQRTVPPRTEIPDVETAAQQLQLARGYHRERLRDLPISQFGLPPSRPWPTIVEKVHGFGERIAALRVLVGEQRRAVTEWVAATSALRAAKQEDEQTRLELETTLAALGVCPICGRPMEVAQV